LTVQILSHLPQLSSLRELTVGGNATTNVEQDYRYFEAISHYLSSTVSLLRLHLANLSFDGPSMAQVLNGLLVHLPANVAPSIFIASLSFSQCTLTDEAIEQLVAFLQTPIITDNQNETEASFVNKSCLRELFVQVDPTSTSRFATGLADALLMIEKTSKTSKGHEKKTDDLLSRTIGSQICSVQIVGVQSEFLHHLRCHASRARFQTLALDQISKSASVALSKCLPHLVHLEELIVKDVEAGSSTNWIVQGLRSNGSICYVSTENDDGDETNFDATQLRLIQAYCDRNKALGPMIAAEIAPDPTCDRDTTGKGDINDDASNSRCSQAPVSQRPTLLQASKPTFRIQGSLALRGLLALDQSQDETWTGEE
jgi:hypothetical protein